MKREEATLRTKTALSAALKRRMAQKPLSKITVSEIIADCDVNRKTFYYHFTDIYDLLKWTLEQEAVEVVRHFDLLVDYEEAVQFVIGYVTSNAHILNCAYDTLGRDEMRRFLYQDFVSVARGLVDSCERDCGLSVEDDFKDFICSLLTEGVAGLLVRTFKEGAVPPRETVARHVAVVIDSLPDLLRRAPQKAAL